MFPMRKLNDFYRALHKFLSDPAGHVVASWAMIRGAIDPKPADKNMRDALVVMDNMVEAVVHFLGSDLVRAKGEAGQETIEGTEP